MKIEQLSENCYRVRKTIKGKKYSVTFDHKPSQKEVMAKMNERIEEDGDSQCCCDSFEGGIRAYLELKSNILSPSTIRGYKTLLNAFSTDFLKTRLVDMDSVRVQKEINEYAKNHSAKSTKNMYGLISIVMKTYYPTKTLRVQLPQADKKYEYIPTDEEVKRIIDYLKGSEYYVPTCLAALGMRKSEVCAVKSSDLDENNLLTINKVLIKNDKNEYIIKNKTKTTESTRQIYIPKDVADLIRKNGYAYNGFPDNITRNLTRVQNKLGIEHFSLHKLRHFFVTYCHNELHLSPEQIKDAGGWKRTSSIMETVYQHSMKQEEAKKKIANDLGRLF